VEGWQDEAIQASPRPYSDRKLALEFAEVAEAYEAAFLFVEEAEG
jgi:hypothetical protein